MFNDFPLYTTDYISGVMSLHQIPLADISPGRTSVCHHRSHCALPPAGTLPDCKIGAV